MLQQLFINFAAKLTEMQNLEPNGAVSRVLSRAIFDSNLDDRLVEQLWHIPEIRSVLKNSIALPKDEQIYKQFLKNFPYRTFLRNQNDPNYLRIFFAQKANEFNLSMQTQSAPATSESQFETISQSPSITEPQTADLSTQISGYQPLPSADTQTPETLEVTPTASTETTTQTQIEQSVVSDSNLQVDNKTEFGFEIQTPTEQTITPDLIPIPAETVNIPESSSANIEFNLAVQRQESIMQNKRNRANQRRSTQQNARPNPQNRPSPTQTNRQAPVMNSTQPKGGNNIAKFAVAASVGGLSAISSLPLVSFFLS